MTYGSPGPLQPSQETSIRPKRNRSGRSASHFVNRSVKLAKVAITTANSPSSQFPYPPRLRYDTEPLRVRSFYIRRRISVAVWGVIFDLSFFRPYEALDAVYLPARLATWCRREFEVRHPTIVVLPDTRTCCHARIAQHSRLVKRLS